MILIKLVGFFKMSFSFPTTSSTSNVQEFSFSGETRNKRSRESGDEDVNQKAKKNKAEMSPMSFEKALTAATNRKIDSDTIVKLFKYIKEEATLTNSKILLSVCIGTQEGNREKNQSFLEQLHLELGNILLNDLQDSLLKCGRQQASSIPPEVIECANKVNESFKSILQNNPSNGEAIQGMLSLNSAMKRFNEALYFCKELLQSDPNNVIWLRRKAELYLKLNDFENAKEVINEALKGEPNSEISLIYQLLILLKQYESSPKLKEILLKIRICFEKFSKMNKNPTPIAFEERKEHAGRRSWALNEVVRLFMELGDFNKALESANILIDHSDNPKTRALRGLIYDSLKNKREAFIDYRTAMRGISESYFGSEKEIRFRGIEKICHGEDDIRWGERDSIETFTKLSGMLPGFIEDIARMEEENKFKDALMLSEECLKSPNPDCGLIGFYMRLFATKTNLRSHYESFRTIQSMKCRLLSKMGDTENLFNYINNALEELRIIFQICNESTSYLNPSYLLKARADLYIAHNQLTDAKIDLLEALKYPGNKFDRENVLGQIDIRIKLAKIFFEEKEFEQALIYVEKNLEIKPFHSSSLYLKGMILYESGDYKGSYDLFDDLKRLKVDSRSEMNTYKMLAFASFKMGPPFYQKALEASSVALAINDKYQLTNNKDQMLMSLRAQIYFFNGEYQHVLDNTAHVLSIPVDGEEAPVRDVNDLVIAIVSLIQLDRGEEALNHYNQLNFVGDRVLLDKAFNVLKQSKRNQQIIEICQQLLLKEEDYKGFLLLRLGEAYHLTSQDELAAKAFQDCLGLNDHNCRDGEMLNHFTLLAARIFEKSGNPFNALAAANDIALRLSPEQILKENFHELRLKIYKKCFDSKPEVFERLSHCESFLLDIERYAGGIGSERLDYLKLLIHDVGSLFQERAILNLDNLFEKKRSKKLSFLENQQFSDGVKNLMRKSRLTYHAEFNPAENEIFEFPDALVKIYDQAKTDQKVFEFCIAAFDRTDICVAIKYRTLSAFESRIKGMAHLFLADDTRLQLNQVLNKSYDVFRESQAFQYARKNRFDFSARLWEDQYQIIIDEKNFKEEYCNQDSFIEHLVKNVLPIETRDITLDRDNIAEHVAEFFKFIEEVDE